MHEALDQVETARIAAFLLYLLRSAELQPDTPARFLLREARLSEVGYLFFNVKVQFLVESRLLIIAPQ
ncbi:MAG TPA: hypothetical protein VGL72_10705 [Bryobacteraceae bacterium]